MYSHVHVPWPMRRGSSVNDGPSLW